MLGCYNIRYVTKGRSKQSFQPFFFFYFGPATAFYLRLFSCVLRIWIPTATGSIETNRQPAVGYTTMHNILYGKQGQNPDALIESVPASVHAVHVPS